MKEQNMSSSMIECAYNSNVCSKVFQTIAWNEIYQGISKSLTVMRNNICEAIYVLTIGPTLGNMFNTVSAES